mmetsp:Transcript_5812/g.12248  ORF Transcript_5812/g.12248 Transcript_5812/m.12248 type:complete len:293 (+) Transcript_5812:40-918(+)
MNDGALGFPHRLLPGIVDKLWRLFELSAAWNLGIAGIYQIVISITKLTIVTPMNRISRMFGYMFAHQFQNLNGRHHTIVLHVDLLLETWSITSNVGWEILVQEWLQFLHGYSSCSSCIQIITCLGNCVHGHPALFFQCPGKEVNELDRCAVTLTSITIDQNFVLAKQLIQIFHHFLLFTLLIHQNGPENHDIDATASHCILYLNLMLQGHELGFRQSIHQNITGSILNAHQSLRGSDNIIGRKDGAIVLSVSGGTRRARLFQPCGIIQCFLRRGTIGWIQLQQRRHKIFGRF